MQPPYLCDALSKAGGSHRQAQTQEYVVPRCPHELVRRRAAMDESRLGFSQVQV